MIRCLNLSRWLLPRGFTPSSFQMCELNTPSPKRFQYASNKRLKAKVFPPVPNSPHYLSLDLSPTIQRLCVRGTVQTLHIFRFPLGSHCLPWWRLCTLLAFSQAASWGNGFPTVLFPTCWTLERWFSFTLRSNSSQSFSVLALGLVIVEVRSSLCFYVR